MESTFLPLVYILKSSSLYRHLCHTIHCRKSYFYHRSLIFFFFQLSIAHFVIVNNLTNLNNKKNEQKCIHSNLYASIVISFFYFFFLSHENDFCIILTLNLERVLGSLKMSSSMGFLNREMEKGREREKVMRLATYANNKLILAN